MIHTNVNFSGVIEDNRSSLHSSIRSTNFNNLLAQSNSNLMRDVSRTSYHDPNTMAFIETMQDQQIEEEVRGEHRDSSHPYNSFNLTMEEEHLKIRN